MFAHTLIANRKLVHDLDPLKDTCFSVFWSFSNVAGHGVQELEVVEMTSLGHAARRAIAECITKVETFTKIVVGLRTVVEEKAGWIVGPDEAADVFPLLFVEIGILCSFGEANLWVRKNEGRNCYVFMDRLLADKVANRIEPNFECCMQFLICTIGWATCGRIHVFGKLVLICPIGICQKDLNVT